MRDRDRARTATNLAFAAGLRAARRKGALTQASVAERAGLHRDSVSHVELCVGSPSLVVAERLALAVGSSVVDLIISGRELARAELALFEAE